jgi:phage/plasmid-like protein (TIGR03299 family)
MTHLGGNRINDPPRSFLHNGTIWEGPKMPHLIGKMFYVGEVPWHGLGTLLPALQDLEGAIAAGGLDWTVSTRPLSVAGESLSVAPQRLAVVRDDRKTGERGRVLGVVHPQFQLLQNRDGLALFDGLFEGGGKYETGGYLKEGEVVWLQAALAEPIQVGDNDELKTYLLFSNSHDGTRPIDIRLTTVRVVCNNTLTLATRAREAGTFFRRGHNLSLEKLGTEAKAFFGLVLQDQSTQQEIMKKMAAARCDDTAFRAFLEKLLPDPLPPASAATNRAVAGAYATRLDHVRASRQAMFGVRRDGCRQRESTQQVQAEEETWWGTLNAITAWVDHVQEVKGSAFAHQMFGAGNDFKSSAYARIRTELSL